MGYRGSLMFHGSSAEATSRIVAVILDRNNGTLTMGSCFAALCSQPLSPTVLQQGTASVCRNGPACMACVKPARAYV